MKLRNHVLLFAGALAAVLMTVHGSMAQPSHSGGHHSGGGSSQMPPPSFGSSDPSVVFPATDNVEVARIYATAAITIEYIRSKDGRTDRDDAGGFARVMMKSLE